LAEILYNSELIIEERKIVKDKAGDVRSVIPFPMTKNNTALNRPHTLRRYAPWLFGHSGSVSLRRRRVWPAR